MRRAHLVPVGLVAIALAAIAAFLSGGSPERADDPPLRPRVVVRRPLASPIATTEAPSADPVDPEVVERFARRVDDVARSCGVPIEAVCDGDTCVGFTSGPDLDGILGWLELGWTRPRFVLSTIGRDVGVPARLLPCGAAIDGLDERIAAVELADGTELWCTGASPEAARLCDAVAAERYGPEAAGFGRADVRTLRFDR